MNPDPYPQIIDLNEPSQHTKFPIVLQLGILFVFLGGMFGFLYLEKEGEQQVAATLPPTATPNTSANIITTPQKIEEVSLRANAAFVWDVKAQRVLFEKNSNETLPLASITKLMTALLAHELISEDTVAQIDRNAIRQEGSTGFIDGEEVTAEGLRDLALNSSSNDAAFALGANVGELLGENDPTAQFVRGMNIRASQLGLETLEFYNTTGLDVSETQAGAYGSARDVSFLMEHIIQEYPDILTATTEETVRVFNENGAYHEVSNTNNTIDKIPNLIGSKTGFTDLAGGNLTIAFDAGFNRPIVVTVLGSTREERFSDVLTLVEEVQTSFE